MDRLYGFHTPGTERPKATRNPARMSRIGTGHTHAFTGEVVVLNPRDKEVVAHEISHTQGVKRESEAELTATVALLQSDDPRLRYYGFDTWLKKLAYARRGEWFKGRVFSTYAEFNEALDEFLAGRGLNEQSLRRMRETREEYDRLRQTDTSGRFMKAFKKFDANFSKGIDGLTHGSISRQISRRQRSKHFSITQRYDKKPLELLHDYRRKYFES